MTVPRGFPERLNRKDDIVEFLCDHPSWFLEVCHGSGLYWWWAVGNSKWPGGYIHCNGNAAVAALKNLIRHGRHKTQNGVMSSIEDVRWSAHKKISWAKPKRPARSKR